MAMSTFLCFIIVYSFNVQRRDRTVERRKCFFLNKKEDIVGGFKQSVYICRHKTTKDNEKSIGNYILVALFTTPAVVREQRSCIYTIRYKQ